MTQITSEKSSLKGKALSLQKLLYELQLSMETHKRNVTVMQNQHNGGSTFNVIQCKSKKIRSSLEMELEQIQTKLKTYIASRKSDNLRLWEEIANIKNQRSYLQKYLGLIETRIQQVEDKLGIQS